MSRIVFAAALSGLVSTGLLASADPPLVFRPRSGAQSSVEMPMTAWGRVAGVVRRADAASRRIELAITDESVFPEAGKWKVFWTEGGDSEPAVLSFLATGDANAWALKPGDRVSMRCRPAADGGLELAAVETLATSAVRATTAHPVTSRHDLAPLLAAMAPPRHSIVRVKLASAGVDDISLKTSAGSARPFAMYYRSGNYTEYGLLDPVKPPGRTFDDALDLFFAVNEGIDPDVVRLEFHTKDGAAGSVPITLLPGANVARGLGHVDARTGAPVQINEHVKLTARWEKANGLKVPLDEDSPSRTIYLPEDVAIARLTFDGATDKTLDVSSPAFMLLAVGGDGRRRAVSALAMQVSPSAVKGYSSARHGASFALSPGHPVEIDLLFALDPKDAIDGLLISGSCSGCPSAPVLVR